MAPYIEVCIDPDGVNGDVEIIGDYDGPEIRVIVTRGIEREVIHDSEYGSYRDREMEAGRHPLPFAAWVNRDES